MCDGAIGMMWLSRKLHISSNFEINLCGLQIRRCPCRSLHASLLNLISGRQTGGFVCLHLNARGFIIFRRTTIYYTRQRRTYECVRMRNRVHSRVDWQLEASACGNLLRNSLLQYLIKSLNVHFFWRVNAYAWHASSEICTAQCAALFTSRTSHICTYIVAWI